MTLIPDFSRKGDNREPVVNIYLIIPKHCKKPRKMSYNKQKYKIFTVHDPKKLKEMGYDRKVDKVYILMIAEIEKAIKKSPNILVKATILYDEKTFFKSIETVLN